MKIIFEHNDACCTDGKDLSKMHAVYTVLDDHGFQWQCHVPCDCKDIPAFIKEEGSKRVEPTVIV